MKKIFFYLIASVLTSGFFTSCGDNEDISSLHVLTDEEIAEIRRQEIIDSINAATINVDLLIEQDVTVTILANGYDGTKVDIDTVQIAEFFGITPTQLNEGIMNMRSDVFGTYDAPKIVGFCIEGTTHADNMTAYNTNSCWGHWWDENGNTTAWGDNARVYCEYDPEARQMHIGQMPGLLTDGQYIEIIECLKYQDLRVGIKFKVTAAAMGEVKAEIVNTQQLSLAVAPNDAYATTLVQFDLEKALSDLGISSIAEAKFVGYKPDGSFAQEYSADPNGFYYDKEGFVGSWGDNASVFVTHPAVGGDTETTEDYIAVGQMPGAMVEGDQITVNFGIMANNKIEMLEIAIEIIGYQDPETKPEGDPYEKTIDVTLEKGYTADWSGAVSYTDIQEILRDAFKMTTYELYTANKEGTFKMYVGEVGTEAPEYTAAAPGYWLTGEGVATGFGENSAVFAELHMSETSIDITVGNHPDMCDPNGMTIPVTLVCVVDGNAGKVTINLTIKIVAFVDPETAPEGDPYDHEEEVSFTFAHAEEQQWDANADVSAKVKDALKVTSHEFATMMKSGDIKLYLNEITETPPTQCWEGSFYVDAEGNPTEEATAACIVGLYPYSYADGGVTLEAATMPANNQPGQTINTTLIVVGKGVTVTLPITVEITE